MTIKSIVPHLCALCNKPVHCRGYCHNHYSKLVRDGVLKTAKHSRTREERFWPNVQKSDGCWLWTGSHNDQGYGQISIKGKKHIASRLSWEINCGPIPEGLWALHICDNPPCVRPSHLHLGDRQDNADDMVSRNRQDMGADRHNAIFTEQNVLEIIDLVYAGYSDTEISKMYGSSRVAIYLIRVGTNWKQVPRTKLEGMIYERRTEIGENHHHARLKEPEVIDIMNRARAGENQRIIAEQFAITGSVVSAIKLGKVWRHITAV